MMLKKGNGDTLKVNTGTMAIDIATSSILTSSQNLLIESSLTKKHQYFKTAAAAMLSAVSASKHDVISL